MNCTQLLENMDDFLDGTLGAAESVELSAHLNTCGSCRHEYTALKNTQTLLRHAVLPADSALQERVYQRYRARVRDEFAPALTAAPHSTRHTPLGRARSWSFGLVAAAVVALGWIIATVPNYQMPVPVVISNETAALPAPKPVQVLPAPNEIDQMTAVHALHSADVLGSGSQELYQDAQAQANARLGSDHAEDVAY